MKILKNYKKRAIEFRTEVRRQLATDKTIIADTFEKNENKFVIFFNNIYYANGYDVYNTKSIQVYFSGIAVLSEYIIKSEFKKNQIILTFDNSDGYFDLFTPDMVSIKGKFIDS